MYRKKYVIQFLKSMFYIFLKFNGSNNMKMTFILIPPKDTFVHLFKSIKVLIHLLKSLLSYNGSLDFAFNLVKWRSSISTLAHIRPLVKLSYASISFHKLNQSCPFSILICQNKYSITKSHAYHVSFNDLAIWIPLVISSILVPMLATSGDHGLEFMALASPIT